MSNINPQNIDGTFPIAGQDNNSQGFRDNFTNTINNFTFAAAELTDLQSYAVLKSALGSVGQTGTPINDMNYTYITAPQLKKSVETMSNIGINTDGSVSVDWTSGHYQTVYISGDTGITFPSTWPASNLYTKLRLQVNTNSNIANVSFSGVTVNNISSIQGYATGQSVILPANNQYLFEFGTSDNGTTLTIQDVLRNYNSAAAATITSLTATTLTATTATATTLTATTATVSGNLVTSGGIVESGYQIYKPTGNVAIQANVNVSRVIIAPTPAGGITSFFADVTLPNVAVNGKLISITSNVAVGTLRVLSPWVGYTVDTGANAALAANSTVNYLFHSADNKWFKV